MTEKLIPYDGTRYMMDEEHTAAYLQVATEEATAENDPTILAHAIKTIAKARGMTELAKVAGIPRDDLYTLLDELQQLLPPHSSRHRQRSVLTKLLERVTARDRYGELIPYCGILIYWLERMLRELEGEHTAG